MFFPFNQDVPSLSPHAAQAPAVHVGGKRDFGLSDSLPLPLSTRGRRCGTEKQTFTTSYRKTTYHDAGKNLACRLLKNAQIQGVRNPEE